MQFDRRSFLGASAALVVAGTHVSAAAPPVTRGNWSNWPGNVRFSPEGIARPGSVDDVVALVRSASRVKAVGSGHSFNPCTSTSGVLVTLDRMKRVLSVDAERGRVTAEAGLTVRKANNRFAREGLVVPSLGNSFYQTLAGATSTATHGSGMAWGTLSDGERLVGIQLVTGEGEVLDLSDDRPGDAELLAAARVGLGALGVVTAVTMQLAPMHDLEIRHWKGSIDEALDPARWADNDHYEFFWFPFTEGCWLVTRNVTTEKRHHQGPIRDWWNGAIIENIGLKAVLKPMIKDPARTPEVMAKLYEYAGEDASIDRADQVMTNPRHLRGLDLEHGVPVAQARQAFDVVRATAEDWAQKGFWVNLPIQMRFVRADKGTLLSHAQEDTAYVDVAVHGKTADPEPFFRDLDARLAAIGSRPHWGKLFWQNPIARYPDFGRWSAVRQALDPNGRFLNPWLQGLLDGAPDVYSSR